MESKVFWQSKEIWVVALGVFNYILHFFGLPSFEPSAEFYGALLIVMGALRLWWTSAKLSFKKVE